MPYSQHSILQQFIHISIVFFFTLSYCIKHCGKHQGTLSFEDVVCEGGSAVMVKTEADSSNVTDSLHHVQPTTGMFDYSEIRPCHVL